MDRAAMQSFRDHAGACPKCARVDFARPATLVEACLDGGAIAKSALNAIWHMDRVTRSREERRAERGRAPGCR